MSALTGIDAATLAQWRADAQNALQRLMIGENAQAQGYDGKTVTYTPADEAKLRAWINTLNRALGAKGNRRAFKPFFGG